MTISVYVPLLLSMLLAALSRPLAGALPPRAITPTLVIAAGLTAAASTWGLVLLAATLLQEAPPVAERAGAGGLADTEPVPGLVAAAAAAMLAVGIYRLAEVSRKDRATHQALRGLCDANPALELVVLSTPEPQAIAVPGRRGQGGRILVTSGMLAALDDGERAVLLAHERAHLHGRHHWQRAIVDGAAALNPLLRPTREAVTFLLERCADEAAAEVVGSRRTAARALAKAALAATDARCRRVMAFQRLAVTIRVAALQAAQLPERRLPIVGVIMLSILTTLAAADATHAFVDLAERFLPI